MTAAQSRQVAFVIALGLPLVLIACVYVAQFGFGLSPCEMCWWQRYGHFAAIGLALAGWTIRKSPAGTGLIALAGLAIGVSAGIGLLHAGVEYHWWQGLASCSGNLDTSQSLSALEQQLLATPVIPCDRPAWTMFGISMAGYDFVYATALGLFCLIGAVGLMRRR